MRQYDLSVQTEFDSYQQFIVSQLKSDAVEAHSTHSTVSLSGFTINSNVFISNRSSPKRKSNTRVHKSNRQNPV